MSPCTLLVNLSLQGDLRQKEKEAQREEDENFGNSWVGQTRTWIWKTMEYPWTSKLAQVSKIYRDEINDIMMSTIK